MIASWVVHPFQVRRSAMVVTGKSTPQWAPLDSKISAGPQDADEQQLTKSLFRMPNLQISDV